VKLRDRSSFEIRKNAVSIHLEESEVVKVARVEILFKLETIFFPFFEKDEDNDIFFQTFKTIAEIDHSCDVRMDHGISWLCSSK
jgi:hypothetical protein